MKILKKIEKWFDLNCSWFFINGMKREAHQEYLRNKYNKDI